MPLTREQLKRLAAVAPPGTAFSVDPDGLCVATAWCPRLGRRVRWSERWTWDEVAEELEDWKHVAAVA